MSVMNRGTVAPPGPVSRAPPPFYDGATMADEAPGAQNQSQSQSNQQLVTINVATANPDLERRIFSGVHSPGRQLGRMADVIEALIAATPGLTNDPRAKDAVDAFRSMQADILREKHRGDPRYLVEYLEALQRTDPQGFPAIAEPLRTWLNGQPQPAAPSQPIPLPPNP